MEDKNKQDKPREELPITPALKALLKAKATGESTSHDIPVPQSVQRALDAVKKHDEQEQDPQRRIGPRNPDHPNVNTEPGGRKPD